MWKLYIEYLKQWAEDHSDEECEGMSPACYDEWVDNEFYEDIDEDLIERIKQEYHKNDVCMVGLISDMIDNEGLRIKDNEIMILLNWAGEDDVTPAEVRAGGID